MVRSAQNAFIRVSPHSAVPVKNARRKRPRGASLKDPFHPNTTVTSQPQTCRGVGRRNFLKAGVMGFGGLTLADMLRAENAAGIRSSSKAVINIHLDGGPPQMDLIDPKPDAPSEIRGEFGSFRTKIPGFHVTEFLPRLAANAGKYVFLRSLVGADGKHDAFQCQSGFTEKEP